MLDKKVEKIYSDFVSFWNAKLQINSQILLDETWPSIGVLDLLTFSLRFKEQIPHNLESLIVGSSAYISRMLCECWKEQVEQVRVFINEGEICVEAKGGDLIPERDSVFVPVERLLRDRLRSLPNPFPITRKFSTNISFDSRIISDFCLGLFTGQAEGIEGPFLEYDEKKLSPLIEAVTKNLAITSAQSYEKHFPDEPIGQMAELYLQDLIYPPMFMKEDLPCLSSIVKLLDYFKSLGIKKENILALGQNLSLSPNFLFSNIGLIICCAISDSLPSVDIVSVAKAKGPYNGMLRKATLKVREFFNDSDDWIAHGLQSLEDEKCFFIETNLGFFPGLILSHKRLKKDLKANMLSKLLTASSNFDYELGEQICEVILEKYPDDIEIHFQYIHFKMLRKKFEEAHGLLNNLLDNPDADSSMMFYNLRGLCALELKNNDVALKNFKTALKIKNHEDFILLSEINNNAAWASILLGNIGEAMFYLEQSLSKSVYPVNALLNKASILWDLGVDDEYEAFRNYLFSICPLDRRVFSHLTLQRQKT